MSNQFSPITLTRIAPNEVRVRTQPFDCDGSTKTAISAISFGAPYGHAVVNVQPTGDTAREQLMNAITLGRHIVEQAAELLAELETADQVAVQS